VTVTEATTGELPNTVCRGCGSVERFEFVWSAFGKDIICAVCHGILECIGYGAVQRMKTVREIEQ
jgi:hypothetical protein